jgi:hypothetical protein
MKRGVLVVCVWLAVAMVGHLVGPADAAAEDAAAVAGHEERERRVVTFVETHQPDLAKVLADLRKRKPAEYARAIEELDRSVQPLTSGKAKDPALHDLDLRAWQARTRVELLGARWMAGKGGKGKNREALERQLREAIAAELDIKAERLAYRKQRSAAWYDRQITRLSTKREDLVEDRLKAIRADE